MRTSFKHQQLRIMKAHFQINQNPDSKDLKELSEKTGLQKRVLQVWFQNSRAKQRKSSTPSSNLHHSLGGGAHYDYHSAANTQDSEINELLEIEDSYKTANSSQNNDEEDDEEQQAVVDQSAKVYNYQPSLVNFYSCY